MIDFILLVIVIVLAWVVCISILFRAMVAPTKSLTSHGFDFYLPKHIPIIIKPNHNTFSLSEYCNIHNYDLHASITSSLVQDPSNEVISSAGQSDSFKTYAIISKPLSDKYQSLEPLIAMANGATVIITDSGNDDSGRFIPDLVILRSFSDDSIYEHYHDVIDEEIKRFYLRPLSRNLTTAHDNIHLKPLTLKEIINMEHHRTLLNYGCPVRIGKLCIISSSCVYNTEYVPYPRSKHENGLACSHRAAIKTSIPSKIPKIIHQTYETMILPHCVTQCVDTWLSLNPEYEYKYYTDEDCREFISENFPQRVLSAYDTLYAGAYKADLWRCCVLYIEGGIYADIKMLPSTKLIKFIDNEADIVLTSDISLFKKSNIAIFNAFMGAVPRHPVFLDFINAIVDNVEKRSYEGGLYITGPALLGRLFSDRLKLHNISLTSHPTTINVDGKVFDDNVSHKIQMLSLRLFTAIYDTAIISEDSTLVVYRRNPYNSLSHDAKIFYRTSGKPNYGALLGNRHVYLDDIYPIITPAII